MTKEQLWAIYSDKNHSFTYDGTVTMSSSGLRKMFDQTWDIAYNEALNKSTSDTSANGRYKDKQVADFMRMIYGKN